MNLVDHSFEFCLDICKNHTIVGMKVCYKNGKGEDVEVQLKEGQRGVLLKDVIPGKPVKVTIKDVEVMDIYGDCEFIHNNTESMTNCPLVFTEYPCPKHEFTQEENTGSAITGDLLEPCDNFSIEVMEKPDPAYGTFDYDKDAKQWSFTPNAECTGILDFKLKYICVEPCGTRMVIQPWTIKLTGPSTEQASEETQEDPPADSQP